MNKSQVPNVIAHEEEKQVKVKHIDFVFCETAFESQPGSKVLLREHLFTTKVLLTFACERAKVQANGSPPLAIDSRQVQNSSRSFFQRRGE